MSTLLPEPPPADVLLIAFFIVLLVVLAAALFAVMFGKTASERFEECAELDLAEQAQALSTPAALGGYQPIRSRHPAQPPSRSP